LTLESYDSARLVNGGDHETGSSLGGPTFGCKRLQTNDIEINAWTGFFILKIEADHAFGAHLIPQNLTQRLGYDH
jgi:hypothetical protein